MSVKPFERKRQTKILDHKRGKREITWTNISHFSFQFYFAHTHTHTQAKTSSFHRTFMRCDKFLEADTYVCVCHTIAHPFFNFHETWSTLHCRHNVFFFCMSFCCIFSFDKGFYIYYVIRCQNLICVDSRHQTQLMFSRWLEMNLFSMDWTWKCCSKHVQDKFIIWKN